jgi:hypothetical protein
MQASSAALASVRNVTASAKIRNFATAIRQVCSMNWKRPTFRALTAAALVLGCGQAHAGVVPQYDPDGYCASSTNKEVQYAACMLKERRSRDKIIPAYDGSMWSSFWKCENLTDELTRGVGSYSILQQCIEAMKHS